MDPDPEDLIDATPQDIAQAIFNKQPTPPLTNRMLVDTDSADATYIFEILINILLEGLDIWTKGLDQVDLTDFNKGYITALNPWFHSLGFEITVQTHAVQTHAVQDSTSSSESVPPHYCRVVLNRGATQPLFDINGVQDRSYHFLLNGAFLDGDNEAVEMCELTGLFEAGDVSYYISFNYYVPPDLSVQLM